jgi:hypothetical protein
MVLARTNVRSVFVGDENRRHTRSTYENGVWICAEEYNWGRVGGRTPKIPHHLAPGQEFQDMVDVSGDIGIGNLHNGGVANMLLHMRPFGAPAKQCYGERSDTVK